MAGGGRTTRFSSSLLTWNSSPSEDWSLTHPDSSLVPSPSSSLRRVGVEEYFRMVVGGAVERDLVRDVEL
jgi:hypothetical protein